MLDRARLRSGEDFPSAHSIRMAHCGPKGCGCPHLILLDKEGGVIADAIITHTFVQALVDFDIKLMIGAYNQLPSAEYEE